MVMREVKHLTTNTPQDKSNSDPIWSKDGKYIVYTQEQAKGTDSNIFIADVATGKSTLLTPHEGEQRYYANDYRSWSRFPMEADILFTSNAANGYENIGLLDFGDKAITGTDSSIRDRSSGSRTTNGKSAAASSRPTASTSPSAPTLTATKIFICTTSPRANQRRLPSRKA